MKNYESMDSALSDLRSRGYQADFSAESFCLYCSYMDIRLDPDSFHVDEIYRFDGVPNPDDSSALYAISTPEGIKGTLVDECGEYCKILNPDMTKKLRGPETLSAP